MKRKESNEAIQCYADGPSFNDDIHMEDQCNNNRCKIANDGTNGYDCHPVHKKSLFVNTNKPDCDNYFTVLEYEVFSIDYKNRENINKLCKYPDIIWEYIETDDITDESLKLIEDSRELLNDLDAIICNDQEIRLKVMKWLNHPSEYLPNTQIVNIQYDEKLKEWLGNDSVWRLLYRASEHKYTASSFHKQCNNKGPTLIIIKSSEGWIFGGYTTQSWGGDCIYYVII